ncbi:MAG: RNA polymerase sigma factor [Bryobacteraceae bacterium]
MKTRDTSDDRGDNHLLQRARGGDEDAFAALFHRHHSSVFRFLMYMSGSREIAEEVAQDVFLALLSKKTNYSEALGDLQAFILGMARNQLRKQFRRLRAASNCERIPNAVVRPELFETISREQELAALKLAILRLPPRYREAIVLCELEGLDLAHAAEQLGCALGTVKSRLNRARTILRAKLRDREGCPA